jgi:glycosyltransferase involved in cell wall biosynthesis
MKRITIFTPTYNRAYLLHNLYESLCRQHCEDFIWLIIDDGSTDNTKTLVDTWTAENKIDIEYYYKENGGMHSAHNSAYDIIKTELNICIDSDDYLTDNAIELILNYWDQNKDEKYAGILGLDIYKNGKMVSNKEFPAELTSGKYYHLKGKYGLVGDIKFVYRTDVIKKYPKYPEFPGEKFTPLGYKYLLIDYDYDMLFLNKPLCVVEYMADGSTKNIIRQYFKNPNGFNYERNIRMKYAYTFAERFKNAMHYVSSSVILKDIGFISKSTNKGLTILAIPFGLGLYFYLKIKK